MLTRSVNMGGSWFFANSRFFYWIASDYTVFDNTSDSHGRPTGNLLSVFYGVRTVVYNVSTYVQLATVVAHAV